MNRRVLSTVATLALAGTAAISGVPGSAVARPGQAARHATRVSTRHLLAELPTMREHTKGYKKSRFTYWDAQGKVCTTRDIAIFNDATSKPQVGQKCTLIGGTWTSPYDGVTVTDPSKLAVDHLVPLGEAWQSGAYRWTAKTRERFANDLKYAAVLVAVTKSARRAKGNKEPQSYLPPDTSYDCTYLANWVAVKYRWHLAVNHGERAFLKRDLAGCGWPKVPKPTRPTIHRTSSAREG